MLSIAALTLKQASSYYTKATEYYANVENQNVEYLNNDTKLTSKNFHEWLKKDLNNKKTACYDLTFSAPKSISIAIGIFDEKELLQYHLQAVKATLETIDDHTNARINKKPVKNGSLEIALITHDTSRELDPDTHTHCIIKNSIKSHCLDGRTFYTNKMKYGREYRLNYANLLRKAGYQIEITDYKHFFFELKGVDNLEKFSKRANQIKATGEQDAVSKALTNLKTRKTKKHNISPEQLKQSWKTEYNGSLIIEKSEPTFATKQDFDNAVVEAGKRLTEHKSYFDDIELNNALKEDLLTRNLAYENPSFDISNFVYKNNSFTTSEIIKSEAFIIKECKRTHQIFEPLINPEKVNIVIEKWEQSNFELTKSQKQTLKNILLSKDGVNVIQGDAGTGKTALLKALKDIVETHTFLGLSTTGKAALEIETASSVKSFTIDSFLLLPKNEIENGVFIIDESSMNSTLKLKDVFSYARKYNARIILQGDVKQLASINAGGMFEYLQNKSYITYSQLTDNIRQKSSLLKSVVYDLSKGKIKKGMQTLDNAGYILETPDEKAAFEKISDNFIASDNLNNLILSNYNSDREAINDLVKSKLISKGIVDKEQHTFNVRTNKNLSNHEKKFAFNYAKDDIIVLSNKPYTVINTNRYDNLITIKSNDGKEKTITPLEKCEVYRQRTRSFAKGDKIIFLKNYNPVKNGNTAFIKDIQGTNLIVSKDNKDLTIDLATYNYIDLGYCITSYKSQGQTADKAFIYSTGSETAENIYVQATRAKYEACFYVKDKEKLYQSLNIHNKQVSAVKKLNQTSKIVKPVLEVSKVSQYTI